MIYKKITIVAGHYGSGKTNIAINFALDLRKQKEFVTLCDLDIVNPYFRTADFKKLYEAANINFISSPYANSNVDVPSVPAAAYSIFSHTPTYAICDVGGDDRGALALGRFADKMPLDNYDMLLVINKFRPNINTPEKAHEIMLEMEVASKIKFTGIINNSNLAKETTAEDIENSMDYAVKVSNFTKLPITHTTYRRDIGVDETKLINPFPIDIYYKEIWKI